MAVLVLSECPFEPIEQAILVKEIGEGLVVGYPGRGRSDQRWKWRGQNEWAMMKQAGLNSGHDCRFHI